jgi:hypothetical protein
MVRQPGGKLKYHLRRNKERKTIMIKLTLRYARYALASLVTIVFAMN